MTQAFAANSTISGVEAIQLLKKLEQSKVITLDGHAMGKTYYRVNESLCLFSGDRETLECNDKQISGEDISADDLENLINISLLTYDGSAMGGKAYFKTNAEFCFITNSEDSTLSCD